MIEKQGNKCETCIHYNYCDKCDCLKLDLYEPQKQNNKIFVVSRGEYSDYYTVGIFTTKNKAKKYIKEVCKNDDYFLERDFSIEEYNIDEGCI